MGSDINQQAAKGSYFRLFKVQEEERHDTAHKKIDVVSKMKV